MHGAGCGGKGGILGGEGRHGLSGLVAEGLRARDRGSVRLQRNQVSHLELQQQHMTSEEEMDRRHWAVTEDKVVKNLRLCLWCFLFFFFT